ncbi:MAG: DUF1553 domain-containing protein [Planctomycetaceae bacterium]|nr:DUF1553 domain-containing protein [Planctomycetaceae bacterium]
MPIRIVRTFWPACVLIVTSALGAGEPRVTHGLQVLYRCDEQQGTVLHDSAEVEPSLNLSLGTPETSQWQNGWLKVTSSARIRTEGSATRLVEAVRSANALTVEVWLRPQDDRQTGPARIVSFSAGPGTRNLTVGQDGNRFDVRLRTTKTSTNGIPSTATPERTVKAGELTHFVYTRDASGAVHLYVNGESVVSTKVEGDLSNWDDGYPLLLANESSGDRPWLGELHLVALYDRALTPSEVEQNHLAGVAASIDYAALLPPAVERHVDFVTDVQPILRERCFECHATGNEEGGLNLGTHARVMEGGEGGLILKAGHSDVSRMIHLVAGIKDDMVMPPEGDRLTDEQVGILRAWIDQGADWPAHADVLDPRTERAREHWAFQPLCPVEVPSVPDDDWSQSSIDSFISATLHEHDLTPTPALGPRKLIRRVMFDLTGLPPTPDELDTFVAAYEQDCDAAVEELVDRLLDSQHFGERWGRHWLDVARYADSDGQEGDRDRPNAFHYRDFVIRAFNDDMPFDQFVRWQIAGDEFEPDSRDAVAATGFLVAGPHTVLADTFLEEERLRNRYNELDDIVSTTGSAFLALTVGCARCHDHKYDAISSREYYRLLSAFQSGDREEKYKVNGKGPQLLAFRDFGSQPAESWLFERADFYDRDQRVQLGFIKVLLRDKTVDEYREAALASEPKLESTYQRRALADWMTDVEHGAGPLLARVIVNRIWQHHFGEGLVKTVDDFGVRGEQPTHPELLEWLANDLVENGWQLKRLHRMIVLSAAYQQGTDFDETKAAVDPQNRFHWRRRPQRLEAEILRDTMLAVSGTLNLEPFGPAFKPPIPREAVGAARNLKTKYPDDAKDEPATHRRTVYMFHKRVVPYPLLQAFDRPDLLKSCGRRDDSTVAPQALAILNDGFVRTRSGDFAQRLIDECGDDNAQLVSRAFALSVGRPPSESEAAASQEFIASQAEQRHARTPDQPADETRKLAVTDFCQTLFGLNEFLYVD